MNLIILAEHTIDIDRLTGGFVLDAGCRNFTFAKELVTRGCKVVALDADPSIANPHIEHVIFKHLALAAESREIEFVMSRDPQARHIAIVGEGTRTSRIKMTAVTIEQFMTEAQIEMFDVVKLDVEGSEYDILANWPGPIATQISVEFHEHCLGRLPDKVYTSIFKRLARFGYEIIQHERDARMGAGMNFWDSLLVLKC